MSDIMQALAAGLDPDLIINREALRYAVQRQILCAKTGQILDIRTAVYYRVVNAEGTSGAEVVTGEYFDRIDERLRAHCATNGIDLEVIDGRQVFA
jgi:hypothetical protein